MAIKIISRKPGFRRAGVEHPAERIWSKEEYDSTFTKEQRSALEAEPMLSVTEVPDKGAAKT